MSDHSILKFLRMFFKLCFQTDSEYYIKFSLSLHWTYQSETVEKKFFFQIEFIMADFIIGKT